MPRHVSIVVFRECDPSIIYGVFDTLWAAGTLLKTPPGEPLFTPRIVAAEHGPMELITGVSIVPQDSIDEVEHTDIVFVPNPMIASAEELHALDPRLIEWIAKMHGKGALICSACGGSLVLAKAGLLAGREATTHWSNVALFRQRVPRRPARSRTASWSRPATATASSPAAARRRGRTSRSSSSRGTAATRRRSASRGSSSSSGTARGSSPMPRWRPMSTTATARSRSARRGSRRTMRAPTSSPRRSRLSGLPKRTFDRRFKAATGYSPLAYIQALRVEEAKQMLETGSATGRGDRPRGRLRGRRLLPPPVPPARRHGAWRLPEEIQDSEGGGGGRRCRGIAVTGHEARGAELALAFRESQRRRVDIAVSTPTAVPLLSGVGLALQRALSVQPLARRESFSRIQYLNPDDTLFVIIINNHARRDFFSCYPPCPYQDRHRPRSLRDRRSCHFA